jgi:hypothetical protein
MTRTILPPEGLRARISISDPWEFFSENGPVAMGRIVSLSEESTRPEFRIELDAPVRSKHLQAREVYARFRHSDGSIERLFSGEEVSCNFSNFSGEDWQKQAPEARMRFIGGLRFD